MEATTRGHHPHHHASAPEQRQEMELGTEHGLALKQAQFMEQQRHKARTRSKAERRKDLAEACLKMRIDVALTFPSTDEKIAAECSRARRSERGGRK